MAFEDADIQHADVALRASIEGFTQRRVDLVTRAVRSWVKALFDLTGRNNLLRYRDLKLGTVDLTSADPRSVATLLRGRPVRASSFFPEDQRGDLMRRLRAIHRKAKENFEERGVQTLHLGTGLATWDSAKPWPPLAPVLLRRAELRPLGAAHDDFEMSLVEEMEVNPPLLHLLGTDFGLSVDANSLLDRVDGVIDEPWELEETYRWLREQAKAIPGFSIEPRLVLANFSYAKLPMVRDLETHLEELVAHDLIAAIAGDEEAREVVRASMPPEEAILAPDHVPPADEFLILDADSSQHYAINAVIAGESLIIKGPPGTGKSQTIANLVSSLVARGKRVLFVAEKRAAIDAVLKRLKQNGLEELVMDLHGGVGSRRAVAQMLARLLNAARTAMPVDRAYEQEALERQRSQLSAYAEALHRKRDPWGVSVYEARALVLGMAESARTDIRIRGDALAALDERAIRKAATELQDLIRLGGLTLATSQSPWARAVVVSEEEVRRAYEQVDELRRRTLPTAWGLLEGAATATGVPASPTLDGWQDLISLWGDVRDTLGSFRPELFDEDLAQLSADLEPAVRSAPARLWAALTSGPYRAAKGQLRSLLIGPRMTTAQLRESALVAEDRLHRWRSGGGTGRPAGPPDLDDLTNAYGHLMRDVQETSNLTGRGDLSAAPMDEVAASLDRLLADQATLVKLPEIHRLTTSLQAVGLEELLEELRQRRASEKVALRLLGSIWLQSILEHVNLTDLAIGAFSAERQERVVEEFQRGDQEQIETTQARVRRMSALRLMRARDQFKEQDQALLTYAGKKRRHEPVSTLLDRAPDVLLSLKPCWAMSPLVVSQVLPARPLFDVVVFDEASQITPADAMTSILRGRQTVVAGDERQLPPTAFFVSETSEDQEDEEEAEALAAIASATDFESILDALKPLLPKWRMLQWHYRSRDERLIAFSNAHFYDRSLTTFPGVGGDVCLRHVPAPWEPGTDTNSPSPEVDAAVELILEHARTRPGESLGVIAMGIKHANRIEETLRQRLLDHPDLDPFFDEDREERFFVKNLERVQGDERDAIILSIGYGKNERGQLVYRFGPLLSAGGERRLNVAVTRAKKRLTLVSSFSSTDMDPNKLSSDGMRLLRQYVQYVESGGANLGDRILEKPELNPFEIDVRDTLETHFPVTPQYGVSGYWIDFAAHHPTKPGRYVLAIECDGVTYHTTGSARERDRLRQDQLERLGWRFHRIWSSEWFYDKGAAVAKTLAAYAAAVAAADFEPLVPPAPARPSAVSDTSAATPASPARGYQPRLTRGLPIADYRPSQLEALARWIESDGVPRTGDDVLSEMMRYLGFKKRGSRIVTALTSAIRRARGR